MTIDQLIANVAFTLMAEGDDLGEIELTRLSEKLERELPDLINDIRDGRDLDNGTSDFVRPRANN